MNGIQNCVPTSTGNELGYWEMGIAVATWQFPIGPVDLWDEAISQDKEMFPPIHIHWEYSSSDCDGQHGDYGIHRPHADEYDNGAVKEYEFWTRNVESLVFAYAFKGELKVSNDETLTAEWYENTEEGGRSRRIYLCAEECTDPTNTVYDQFAQIAGY